MNRSINNIPYIKKYIIIILSQPGHDGNGEQKYNFFQNSGVATIIY